MFYNKILKNIQKYSIEFYKINNYFKLTNEINCDNFLLKHNNKLFNKLKNKKNKNELISIYTKLLKKHCSLNILLQNNFISKKLYNKIIFQNNTLNIYESDD